MSLSVTVSRRLVVDWLPAVALAAVAAHELLYDAAAPAQWVLTQGLIWPLVLRRRAPVAVLAGTVALCLVCWSRSELSTAYLAVLFALHAVAAYRPRAAAVAGAVVVEAGAVLVSLRFAPAGSVNDAVVLATALVVTFTLLGTTQRAQRNYLSVVEDRAAQLARDLEQQAVIAAEAERRRIAREMHDVVAHNVSVMIALSEGAAITADPDRARDSMRQAAVTGREALTELRRVLSVLRGGEAAGRAPQPTLDSLEHLVRDVRAAGLPVSLTVGARTETWPEALQVNVFRIVQEGLTNVMKHACRPTRAEVAVRSSGAGITVTVYDDGQPGPVTPGGNGLLGIRERSQVFGGSVTAGPCAGRGWLLSCDLHPEAAR